MPFKPPAKILCRFMLCRAAGSDLHILVRQRTSSGAWRDRQIMTRACPEHSDTLAVAVRSGVVVHESQELILYIDMVPVILASADPDSFPLELPQPPNPFLPVRVPRSSQCPQRASGLNHTMDTKIRPSGDCIHCGAHLTMG